MDIPKMFLIAQAKDGTDRQAAALTYLLSPSTSTKTLPVVKLFVLPLQ
jgi:hypothetical protein